MKERPVEKPKKEPEVKIDPKETPKQDIKISDKEWWGLYWPHDHRHLGS